MQKQIFKIFFLFSLLISALLIAIMLISVHYYRVDSEKHILSKFAELIAFEYKQNKAQDLKNFIDNDEIYRITIIKLDGSVLYDNKADINNIENHLNRPEVIDAIKYGQASSSRYSITLDKTTIYTAIKLDDIIIRVSIAYDSIFADYAFLIKFILSIILFVMTCAYIAAKYVSYKITYPLNHLKINLNDSKLIAPYKELNPFIDMINSQNTLIEEQYENLSRKNLEINAVIKSMAEGLVLLNKEQKILYINKVALHFFDINKEKINDNFTNINKDLEIKKALELYNNKRTYLELTRDGRIYSVCISNIHDNANKEIIGHAITLLDITERAELEHQRQEFTANVSHELKTPLQSIMGYCDLIENNFIKKDQIPEFTAKIHKQAKNLISLIEDILFLGSLDEKVVSSNEKVTINAVCSEVFDVLLDKAQKRNIKLILKANKNIELNAPYIYIYQLIFNLVDNGIKYNKDDGSVTVSLSESNKNVVIKVKDTGIGIAKEHHLRLFERFYRVDKSHSRQTGGTGLGLSIVKRIALALNGKITLKSSEGKGSSFTIKLDSKDNLNN